jgi:hypothetical protein
MKPPSSRTDGVLGYRKNVYFIAAPQDDISVSLQQAAGNETLR